MNLTEVKSNDQLNQLGEKREGIEDILQRLKRNFFPYLSPAYLESQRDFNFRERRKIDDIKKLIEKGDFSSWTYIGLRELIARKKESVGVGQQIKGIEQPEADEKSEIPDENEITDEKIIAFLIKKFTDWQRKVLGESEWQIFDKQIGALIRLIEAYKDSQKKGLILEMATSEGKSSVVIPLFAAYVGLFEEHVQIQTVTRYLASEDYPRFSQWANELGIGNEVALLNEEDVNNVEVRRKKLKQRFVFGYQPDFVHCFEMEFLEGESQFPKKPFIIIDEIDLVLADELLTPAIIGGEVQTELVLKGLEEDIKKFTNNNPNLFPGYNPSIYGVIDFGSLLYAYVEVIFSNLKQWEEEENDVLKKEAYQRLYELAFSEKEKFRQRFVEIWGGSDEKQLYFFDYPPLFNAILLAYSLREGKDYTIVSTSKGSKIIPIAQASGYGEPEKRFNELVELLLYIKHGMMFSETLIPSVPADSLRMFAFYQLMPRVFGFSGTATPVARRLYEMFGVETQVNPASYRTNRKEHYHFVSDSIDKIYQTVEILENDARNRNCLIVVYTENEATVLEEILKILFPDMEISFLTPQNQEQDKELFDWVSKKDKGGKRRILIAARMIGRGVDIKPVGQVEQDGFLLISFTPFEFERSLRQLIGRVGRRGKPGEVHVFISPDDQIFAGRSYLLRVSQVQKQIKNLVGSTKDNWQRITTIMQPLWEYFEDEAIRGVEVVNAMIAPINWLRRQVMERQLPQPVIEKLVGGNGEWGEFIDFLEKTFIIQLPTRTRESLAWREQWFIEVTRTIQLISDFVRWYEKKRQEITMLEEMGYQGERLIQLRKDLQIKYQKFMRIPLSVWFLSYDKFKRYIETKLKPELEQLLI